jgi:hypothetical protein
MGAISFGSSRYDNTSVIPLTSKSRGWTPEHLLLHRDISPRAWTVATVSTSISQFHPQLAALLFGTVEILYACMLGIAGKKLLSCSTLLQLQWLPWQCLRTCSFISFNQDMLFHKLQKKNTLINIFQLPRLTLLHLLCSSSLQQKIFCCVCVCACVGSCVHIMQIVFS